MTTLEKKLEKLHQMSTGKTESDWNSYKNLWLKSIAELEEKVIHWFSDYERKGLMTFAKIPTYRIEPFIVEYTTFSLEITLSNGKSLLLEPVSGITSDYDGRVDFYMRGNNDKSVSIIRELSKDRWFIVKPYKPEKHIELNKAQLEKIIDEWLE